MDPHYFTHTLTLYECELFVKGLQRRKRIFWEQARYIAYYGIMPYSKADFSFSDMGKFIWEKDTDNPDVISETQQEEELEAFRKLAEERDAEWLKEQANGGRNVNETPSKHEGI